MQEDQGGRGDRGLLPCVLTTSTEAAEERYAEPEGLCVQVDIFNLSQLFYLPRCELCALSGEELEKNEELRRQLMELDRESLSLLGSVQSLQKAEKKVELMEKHRDEFILQVRLQPLLKSI